MHWDTTGVLALCLSFFTMSSANDSPAESSTMSSSQTNSAAMVLSIRTLEHQTKPVTVSRDASVLDLKHAVQGVFQIESNRQRLIFQGKMLKDGQSLTDYGKCYLSVYLYLSLSSLSTFICVNYRFRHIGISYHAPKDSKRCTQRD